MFASCGTHAQIQARRGKVCRAAPRTQTPRRLRALFARKRRDSANGWWAPRRFQGPWTVHGGSCMASWLAAEGCAYESQHPSPRWGAGAAAPPGHITAERPAIRRHRGALDGGEEGVHSRRRRQNAHGARDCPRRRGEAPRRRHRVGDEVSQPIPSPEAPGRARAWLQQCASARTRALPCSPLTDPMHESARSKQLPDARPETSTRPSPWMSCDYVHA